MAIGFSSSCSLVLPKRIAVELPPRPALEACPAKPQVSGLVVGGKVELEMQDALALHEWMQEYPICMQSNAVRLEGHIEKLENRLKAVNQ